MTNIIFKKCPNCSLVIEMSHELNVCPECGAEIQMPPDVFNYSNELEEILLEAKKNAISASRCGTGFIEMGVSISIACFFQGKLLSWKIFEIPVFTIIAILFVFLGCLLLLANFPKIKVIKSRISRIRRQEMKVGESWMNVILSTLRFGILFGIIAGIILKYIPISYVYPTTVILIFLFILIIVISVSIAK